MGMRGQFRPPLGRVVRALHAFASMRLPFLQAECRLVEREVFVRHSGGRFFGCRIGRCLVRLVTE